MKRCDDRDKISTNRFIIGRLAQPNEPIEKKTNFPGKSCNCFGKSKLCSGIFRTKQSTATTFSGNSPNSLYRSSSGCMKLFKKFDIGWNLPLRSFPPFAIQSAFNTR
ncbi:hypothetical protein BLOT_011755 [Blomia tropicalis]|nr:hypothetical protein BLOT_011755 [Blomia tropicalis]